ncbi:MAG: hypothetical protein JSV44_05445 [Candidatus Zixiibacteriota bacterium]|nr:MAG: hypothetical protein JSV44_05445 [candidate division Zixibacteria bacterium]
MNTKNPILFACGLLLLFSGNLLAQVDQFGKMDTIYAEPYQIDATNWGINVSLMNDEEIVGISVPLRFTSGKNRLVADSTIFKGGRAEHFRVKFARSDTAIQSVTIGLIADIGVSVPPIQPGKGRIATVFVSSLDEKKIPSLTVDTTTTVPGNTLQMVNPPVNEIIPVFVVMKETKKETEE